MRTLLFTGPGGAGASTVATAAAVHSARSGARTVLLTSRRPAVAGLDAVGGLEVIVVDPQAALETLWRDRAGQIAEALPQLSLPPASSVVPLPGTAEIALLAELARAEADVLVVDAGPVDRLATLLALPDSLRWWLEQVHPPRLRALGAVCTAAVRAGAVRRGPVDAALAGVPALEALLARVGLTDPGRTAIGLVATADRTAVGTARSAATLLGLFGQRAASVTVRVLPEGGDGAWWAERLAAQEEALAGLREVAGVVGVPERAVPPADVDAVAGLLPATALPGTLPGVRPAPEHLDGGWRLVLPLPFAAREGVELTRWADDLVVTVAGGRRSLRLDSLLRRCRVTSGRLVDAGTASAALEVTFVPDPALWPADLMAAEDTPVEGSRS